MRFIADLHIHSKYSRATSKDMNLEELDRWADDKGILVMATGDFTHPQWLTEIKEKLEPVEPGLFKLKDSLKKKTIKGTLADTRFILTVEISGIYSRGGKTRRIHNLIFAPDIKTAETINTQLSWIGNLKSDGRPILGLDAEELAKIVINTNPEAVIVPAHAWTPWFSVFGSMSGFDSIEECFGKYADKIFAVETGLSSDPLMNWRLSKLDNVALISNSDSHSLQKIGREANIFDTGLSYKGIIEAIKSGIPNMRTSDVPNIDDKNFRTSDVQKLNQSAFVATIEFFPEEGKYHFDGHRVCDIVLSPEESKKHNGICPKCGKKLTIGVMNRVEQLADRKIEARSQGNYHEYAHCVPFYNLISLDEIIAEASGVGTASKKVKAEYENMIKAFGSELKILLETPEEQMAGAVNSQIIEGIKRVRQGRVKIAAGYDGVYGKVSIFDEKEQKKSESQKSLF